MNGRAKRGVRFQRRTPVSIHAKASRGFKSLRPNGDGSKNLRLVVSNPRKATGATAATGAETA